MDLSLSFIIVISIKQGQTLDSLLTEKGISDADETALALQKIKWAAVFSSDLKRALHTAEVIATKFDMNATNQQDLELIQSPLIREVNYGIRFPFVSLPS
jgi:broad specificity phosphatase PhoE